MAAGSLWRIKGQANLDLRYLFDLLVTPILCNSKVTLLGMAIILHVGKMMAQETLDKLSPLLRLLSLFCGWLSQKKSLLRAPIYRHIYNSESMHSTNKHMFFIFPNF